MSSVLEFQKELQALSAGLDKNLGETRQRIDALEGENKTLETSNTEFRKIIDSMNEEFASFRVNQEKVLKQMETSSVIRAGMGEMEKEAGFKKRKDLFTKMLKSGGPKTLTEEERNELYPIEQRALGSLFDSEGGALIPHEFENLIYKAVYNFGGFRTVVTARPTGTKRSSVITMGSINGEWIGEGETSAQQETTFGNVTIDIHVIRVEVPIPKDLLEDSAADLVAELTDSIAMKIAEMEDIAFIMGNGVKKPNGLFTNATLQTAGNIVKTLVAAALSDASNNGVDQLRMMPVKLKAAHRTRGSWMMSAQTEASVRNLKDAYGQYLYHTNVAAGKPNSFDGYPVNISDNCPAIGANNFPIAFGDFNGAYAIRDRQGITIEIDESIYRRQDKVAIFVKKRLGGEPVITETPAVCLLKCST